MQILPYKDFNLDQILALYQSVGWTNYLDRASLLQAAYDNSLCVLAAYQEDQLVGIIRAVGDGLTIVFIQDILVHPDYQGQGIGSALFQAILDKYKDVYQLQLLTDDSEMTKSFYRAMGLTPTNQIGCLSYIRV